MSELTPAAEVAPTPTVSPTQAQAEKPIEKPAAPVDPKAELEAVLKKLGGLEVKAGGKAHKVDSVEKLIRYAQRGLPVEQSMEQLARQRAQLEPVQQLLAQLQSGDDDAAEQALERLLDSGKLDKVAERRLRRIYEREESMKGLSPRERELSAQLEAERSEKTRLATERKQFEERQRAAQEQQQVAAVKEHISGAMTATLDKLGLPPKMEALAVEFMKPVIRATINAGMPLDPEVLADKIQPLFDEMLGYRVKNLEGESLLKFLGDDVGRKVRKALLAQLNSTPAPKTASPEKSAEAAAPGKGWDPRRMF
ncbi:MAG: hypothetical protein ING90_21505 [Rhodocyclaceae bacterium]|nr:hypothetical protein [Rhodocyclaceae bacterium]